jgi:hypothetical protein
MTRRQDNPWRSSTESGLHTSQLRRLLLQLDSQPCPFGCTYCFASFEQYERPDHTLADVEISPELLDGIDVIYPACDTEFFARADWRVVLERSALLGRSISISTKAGLSAPVVNAVAEVSQRLANAGRVLKIGVSVATKSLVAELEPRTPSYAARLKTAERLAAAGIPTALVLRPLLPEIPLAEYEEVMEDFGHVTPIVLVGDEWLGRDARPTISAISGEIRVARKAVNWLAEAPLWRQRSIDGRVAHLRGIGAQRGLSVVQTDLDVMAFWLSRRQTAS